MKRNVMLKAWELFKKGFAETFRECLKAAWSLVKQANKMFQSFQGNLDKLNERVKNEKSFRDTVGKWINGRGVYVGDGYITFTNFKTWVKKGIARIYADKLYDGRKYNQAYVEVK